MMPLNPRGDSGFTLAGFLILAALGASLWKGAPLESVRPTGGETVGYEREYSHKIPARLWQDPFKAVYTHELATAEGSGALLFVKSPQQVIKELADTNEANAPTSPKELTIIAVMLSPGSYPELEERRRRRRQAVLSGLSEESFVPRDPDNLSAFYLPKSEKHGIDCSIKPSMKQTKKKERNSIKRLQSDCFAVPFEWYDYENNQGNLSDRRQVILLWLNESIYVDDPLSKTISLLESLLNEADSLETTRISFSLLGPARSDALRNLVNSDVTESRKWLCNKSNLTEFNIFSPTATVADKDLIAAAPSSSDSQSIKRTPLQQLEAKLQCAEDSRAHGLSHNLLRVIRSDEDLIERVSRELKGNHRIDKDEDHVVLISEWDTYFGRSLPRAFERHFCEEGCSGGTLLNYGYLRGIDGIIPGESPSTLLKQPARNKGIGSTPVVDLSNLRRPVGTGQFDYLRRLADTIRERDRQLRLTTGHGVRAVALLGSDVYDKLLILRALRPELPGAIFLTTDLDAQFLHPSEYNWTRGLMIATTYDLKTSKHFKMQSMPFRDSYQTSVYIATRLIFNPDFRNSIGIGANQSKPEAASQELSTQERMHFKIPPLIFEVGRQKLVPLKDDTKRTESWNYSTERSYVLPFASGLLAISILAIFALHQLRPMAGRMVLVSIAMVVVFTLLGLLIYKSTLDGAGEPTDIASGASIWPAVAMRVLAALLSLVFIWAVVDQLTRNWQDLGSRFFAIHSDIKPEGITLSNLVKDGKRATRSFLNSTDRFRAKNVLPILMILVLMLVMRVVNPLQLPYGQKIWLLIIVFSALIAIWWAVIYGKLLKHVQILSINKLTENCPSTGKATDMWLSYGEYGTAANRFLRTTGYVLVYFAFTSILFTLLGSPSSPCRGEFACGISGATIGFSVLLMLVTLFLVVDAARLCICWVDSMKAQKLDWTNSKIDEFAQTLRIPLEHAEAWMVVHLVGERTAAVTRLIYYPVIIILLLLLARSTYFDNWDFPQALAIVIGINFTIALGSIIHLNHIAKSVRNDILRRLQHQVLADDRPESEEYKATPSERSELVKQLEGLRIGAYLPVWDQPPVRATLMLLGGVALTYAEYLRVLVN